jgi:DNA polymerase III alpha subunit (gram-positive type)
MENQTKFILLDTETGGLYPGVTSLLSLYALALDKNYCILDLLDLSMRPDSGIYSVDPRAMEVNKINLTEHSANAVEMSEAKEIFQSFLEDHSYGKTNKLMIMGHNPWFDVNFIKANLVSPTEWEEYFTYKGIDTSVISLFLQDCGLLPPQLKCNLTTLATYFGLDIENAHSAKADVLLCYAVHQRLMELVQDRVVV